MGKPHKWAKEIKAWADGAAIEGKDIYTGEWVEIEPYWETDDEYEYRIKPQPSEPQPKEVPPFLGMKEIPYKQWVLRFYKMPNDLWYTEGINDEWMNDMVEASKPQPKEPQYLYVYEHMGCIDITTDKNFATKDMEYIGKIKLETEDD